MRDASFFGRWGRWVESSPVQKGISALIVLNAVILGLETSRTAMSVAGEWLHLADILILYVFVAELMLRIGYRRASFFRDGWNVFDFIVVSIALVPALPGLSVLRALRVLRVLRLITVVSRLKLVVQALLSSLPGMGAIALLISLVFYVAAVIATNLFGQDFEEWFGTIGASLYTLFQIMTLESWSMGIVRPVMEKHPYAWIFFVPFIMTATFTMLNLFIAVIVSALQAESAEVRREGEGEPVTSGALLAEIRALRDDVAALRDALPNGSGDR